ncbi:MerR family transcriptional regulator [Luteococcus peritonei]|uniref:MerR family transcriptional regulator n=1 Tax=Luteococcus peritonei TaxID=88874 RepID=A0ABW4RSW1_9ACTN
MDTSSLTIGQVAARSGVSVDAIRYYEREGLLPEPDRDAGGRRIYSPAVLDALVLVGALRDVGFGIQDVREVMALKQMDCVEDRLRGVVDQCHRLQSALDEKARALRAARRRLRELQSEAEGYLRDGTPSCDG